MTGKKNIHVILFSLLCIIVVTIHFNISKTFLKKKKKNLIIYIRMKC